MDVILDTDHLTVLQQEGQPAYERLKARLAERAQNAVGITIVSFKNRSRAGWLI
jgi:hypothetical protein